MQQPKNSDQLRALNSKTILRTMLDDEPCSLYYLCRLIESPNTAKHTVAVLAFNMMHTLWQKTVSNHHDPLPIEQSDFFTDDIFNMYMFLHNLDAEGYEQVR